MISVKNHLQNENVRQFAKFVTIGLSSTLIDLALLSFIYLSIGTPWLVAKAISFTCAVSNGFFWNSRWTFKGLGSGKQHELYMKFFVVNIIGLFINIAITTLTCLVLVHKRPSETFKMPVWLFLTSFVVATCCTFIWNFAVNKFWTFKKSDSLLKTQE